MEDVDPTVLALRTEVEGFLAAEALFRLELCLTEALSNLVLYSNIDDDSVEDGIRLQKADSGIVVQIIDPVGAVPFDINERGVPLEDVDPLAEGGRGLGLILECADVVKYGPQGERNCLSLNFQNRL